MKKGIFILGLFLSCMSIHAASEYLTLELKDGSKFSFLLDKNPVITFENDDLVINGDAATSYAITRVDNYHFTEKDETPVQSVYADELRIVCIDDFTIRVENAQANSQLLLLDASARVYRSLNTDSDGTALVQLPQPKGVYVLVVGNKSFKIIRK